MHAFGEPGNRHRRLALPVELVEPRAKELQRPLEIGDIHRAAAIEDRSQTAQIGVADRRGVDEPRQHRRRREHRDPRMALQRVDDRIDVEMRQYDLVTPSQDVRQCVETGPVRQGTRMEVGVALVERVDVGIIAMAHKEQVAVAEHCAFGSASRPARVEKPRPVCRCGVDRLHRRAAREESGVIRGRRRDDPGQCRDRLLERGKSARQLEGCNHEAGARVAGNMLDFARMQSGIDRNCAEARSPAGEHHFKELGAVLHAQHDTVAGFETAGGETAG